MSSESLVQSMPQASMGTRYLKHQQHVMARQLMCCGWPIPGGKTLALATARCHRVLVDCYAGGQEESKDIFQRHPFVRLVELPSPGALKSQAAWEAAGRTIWQDEIIHGVVRPDLPSKASWSELLPLLGLKKQRGDASEDGCRTSLGNSSAVHSAQKMGDRHWQVTTVAAHTSTIPDLCSRMVENGASIEAGGGGGALLLLTGEHSFRKWGVVNKILRANSFALLKAAKSLRQKGYLPTGIQLWAVENPLTNPVSRLEQKIAAGAEAVILQPPLLAGQFGDWWSAADGKGLLTSARMIVGLPIISSSRNLNFWLGLTGAKGKEAAALLAEFQQAENAGSGEQLVLDWNYRLIQFIKSLPGVAGMHIMPVTPRGWRQLSVFMAEGRI